MQCDGKLLPTLDIYEENTDFLLILASSLDGENQLLFVCVWGGGQNSYLDNAKYRLMLSKCNFNVFQFYSI